MELGQRELSYEFHARAYTTVLGCTLFLWRVFYFAVFVSRKTDGYLPNIPLCPPPKGGRLPCRSKYALSGDKRVYGVLMSQQSSVCV